MKTTLATILSLFALLVQAQCFVLNSIPNITEFEDVTIRYYQVDSTVHIQYHYKGFSNELGESYSFPCDLKYQPAIPRPVWKNENFICFHTGCGSSCFANYLAPLNNHYKANYGGEFLIDTTNTIFMSIYLDTISYQPYLVLENFTSGQTQKEQFTRKDFPGAIPIEYLDYSSPHEKGFTYSNNTLVLYLKDGQKLNVKVKI